jgi:putative hydrolase of the HAD superfamily
VNSPREALDLSTLDAVVFDLGGVLLNLDYDATTRAFSHLAGRDVSSLYSQGDQSVVFDRFERGETTSSEFRRELRTMLGCDASDEALDSAWSALILDVPGEHLDLVASLRRTHRIYLLSNTNEVHIEAFLASYERQHGATRGPWAALFDGVYYSHVVGMRKPEERVFEHLLAQEGLSRTRTLFVDDNPHNVAVARTVGMHALWLDAGRRGMKQDWRAAGLVPTPLDGLPDIGELFARLDPER